MNVLSDGTVTAKAAVASPGPWPEMRETAKAYMSRGELAAFYTPLDPRTNPFVLAGGRLPGRLGRAIERDAPKRALPLGEVQPVVACAPTLELAQLLVYRAAGGSRLHLRVLELRDERFDTQVARRVEDIGVFVGQAGACQATLRVLDDRGIRTVVNWNIQYWPFARSQYELDRHIKPEWLDTFGFTRFSTRLVRRWENELERTQRVLVPSSSVADSLVTAGVPRAKILLAPYGVDLTRFHPVERERAPKGALRVVSLGEMGQRKGIAYLFDIARRLPAITFHVVGWHVAALPEAVPANVEIASNVPDVRPYLQAADVFLFPSLVDGFGLAVLEALACGLPVICSSNAGAQDIVSEGVDGFVIDPRDVGRATELLKELDEDKDRLASMRDAARRKAEQYPWERFHQEVYDQIGAIDRNGPAGERSISQER